MAQTPRYFDTLEIGETASTGKTITEADILMFAAVSTDINPLHLNAEAAATGMFGQRVAHGLLSAGLLSAVMGTQLPGPGTVYVSQSLRFRRPVHIGDTVTASVEVTALDPGKQHVTLRTVCRVLGRTVIDGEAVVIAPPRG